MRPILLLEKSGTKTQEYCKLPILSLVNNMLIKAYFRWCSKKLMQRTVDNDFLKYGKIKDIFIPKQNKSLKKAEAKVY